MSNEEKHQLTLIALARAACSPWMTAEDVELLCWHCGVKPEDLEHIKVTGYSIFQHKEAA